MPFLVLVSAERLVIGRFFQIADGALFVTPSANHRRDGFYTYPLAMFYGGFAEGRGRCPSRVPIRWSATTSGSDATP